MKHSKIKNFMKNRIAALALVVLIIATGIFLWKTNSKELVRACPEHWVFNQMPSTEVTSDEDRQYFIINGHNFKYKEVDIGWIKANCSVKPEIVQ